MAKDQPRNGPPSHCGAKKDKDLNVGRKPANQNGLQSLAQQALALTSTPKSNHADPGSGRDALPGLPSYQGWLPGSVNTSKEQVTADQNEILQLTLPSISSNSTMPGSSSNAAMPQGTSTYKGVNHHRAEQSRHKTLTPKKSRYTPLSSRSDRNKVKKAEPRRPTNPGQHAHRTPLRLASSRHLETNPEAFSTMDTSVTAVRPSRYPDLNTEAFSSMDTSVPPVRRSRYTEPNAEAFSPMDTSVTPLRQSRYTDPNDLSSVIDHSMDTFAGFDDPVSSFNDHSMDTFAGFDDPVSSSIDHSMDTSAIAGGNENVSSLIDEDSPLDEDIFFPDWVENDEDIATATRRSAIDPDQMNIDPRLTLRDFIPHESSGYAPPPTMDDDMETHIETPARAGTPQMATTDNQDAPADQTPKPAKIGRIPKRKPAEKKDLSHLRERPFAPKLDTRARKKGPVVEKVRVNNRLSVKDYRALVERQRKASQTGVLVKRCVETAEKGGNLDKLMAELREELHSLEYNEAMSEQAVRDKSKIMDEGFPTILANPIFPWDIKSDAQVLSTRYDRGDADPHLLRGISTSRPQGEGHKKSMVSHIIEKDYPYGSSAAVVGAGKLVNGQWWPRQICAVRDGAHGALVDGIFGASGKGAYSIVMSGKGYSDVDEGDLIRYCGTSGHAEGPTPSTKRMMESRANGNPIRVLRSHKIKAANSKYRPMVGLRYDGLYQVVESELLDQDTSMWRFTLERCEGQTPIRYQGVEARPNGWDAREWDRL
ncbi:MAG: hypothetical protein Q9203_004406 [Teloschistes exilis]